MLALSALLSLLVSIENIPSCYASRLGHVPESAWTNSRGAPCWKQVSSLVGPPRSVNMRLRGGVEVEVMDDEDTTLNDEEISGAANVVEKIRKVLQ